MLLFDPVKIILPSPEETQAVRDGKPVISVLKDGKPESWTPNENGIYTPPLGIIIPKKWFDCTKNGVE